MAFLARFRRVLVLSLVLPGGCELNLDVVPEPREKADAGAERMDAGIERMDAGIERMDAGTERMEAGTEHMDASTMPSDASTRDANVDATPGDASDATLDAGDASAMPPVRHEACTTDFPAFAPEPFVATDATGRPLFDASRDISCEDAAAYPLCSEVPGPTEDCASCVRSSDGGDELCVPTPDEGGFLVGTIAQVTPDGTCVSYIPPRARARACCEKLAGFDCRAWPFETKGRPGELCERHDDCEAGLVCKGVSPSFFARTSAICMCPEIDPVQYPDPSCESRP